HTAPCAVKRAGIVRYSKGSKSKNAEAFSTFNRYACAMRTGFPKRETIWIADASTEKGRIALADFPAQGRWLGIAPPGGPIPGEPEGLSLRSERSKRTGESACGYKNH